MTRHDPAAQRASRAVVEAIERRVMLDATYHVLANGSFTQDWSNTSMITVNDDWSGVPSIIGYRGDDIVTTTAVDPQTVTAFAGPGGPVVNVLANQTNPNTLISGAVAEFEIANPVVAFQGSGTADAPFILLHLNTSGMATASISYLLRDIDESTDNAVQPVALQYRVGESGSFTNIPAGFVADASAGPSLTLDTPVSVQLPSEAVGVPQLQLRIITTNAAGSDEFIGVDDIVVSGTQSASGAAGFVNASVSVNESAGTAALQVQRVGGSSGAVSVDWDTVNGTAVAGSDFVAGSGTLNWADGDNSTKTINITIINDTWPELTESFTVVLSNPQGGLTLGTSTATVAITDDDVTQPAAVLNELLVNPPGADTSEYVEIRGTPGSSLIYTYFLSIEGDSASNPGSLTRVLDVGVQPVGSNGLLVIKNNGTPVHTFPAETGIITSTVAQDLIQNGTNGFALVYSPNAVITAGLDIDLNNDGVIDNLPAGAVIVDAVGWSDGGSGDVVYGEDLSQYTVPNDPLSGVLFTNEAATRFPNSLTPNSAPAWYAGRILAGTPNGSLETQYNPLALSPNAPSGTPVITPGAANYPQQTAIKGDMNGDDAVNNQDIAPFVLALTDYPAYQAAYPGLDGIFRGDINNDSVLNNQDIAPFVSQLTGPRPSTAPLADGARSIKRSPVRVADESPVIAGESSGRISQTVFATSAPVVA